MRRGLFSTTDSARFSRQATPTFFITIASRTGFCRSPSQTSRSTNFSSAPKPNEGYRVTVDLEQQVVTDDKGLRYSFTIDPFRRDCLLKGLDDIGLTLEHESEISAFEKKNLRVPLMHEALDVKYHH